MVSELLQIGSGKRIDTKSHFMNLTRKVLVIGAAPATISLYSSHLEPAGFSLASASLGDPIIERVRDSKAEAVLLDLSSPSPSGAEAFRRIRSEPDFGSLPLFVLSNGAAATPSDDSIQDARVKVFREGSAPPAEVARAIEEILNARKNGSIIANAPQAQPPVNDDIPADDDLIQDVLPMTRKLCEVVRTFCRTLERERRIDLLAVMRQEARRLRNSFSAANFEVLSAFTSALERLFTALSMDIGTINGSTLKTISHAMDFLVQAASSNSGHEEMERTPIRMLAVDDDPVCLRTLTMLASNTKVLDVVASDGVETALRELKTGDFDLIFSDILMPGMNGFEFVAELRKEPKYHATPVVFVTALSDFETRSRSVLSGGCDLIAKPFTAGEVLVKALTLGLKRRFDSAAVVAQVESPPQEVRANSAQGESQAPSPNNGGNGQATPPPGSRRLQGLAGRGVIVVEGHGGIRSINVVAAELLGYSPDEATKGDIRTLIPDELQSEVNKTLLSRVIAGAIKNQSGVEMTGRRKDNSTIRLQVAMGEAWVQDTRTIICLLQAASPTVAATEEASELPVGTNPSSAIGTNTASAVVANPVIAESTSRFEKRDTTLAELTRTKEYWESCASERAALLDELKNRLRGQNSTVEDLRRETEELKAFCEARVAELEQTRTLSELQAKEHLGRQSELECKCATIQAQVNCLNQSLAKAAADRTAAEQQATELAELRRVMEQDLAASRQREENLRAELTAAEATWAESNHRHGAMGQELCQAQEKIGKSESRLVELENKLCEEAGQRENWEQRAAELEQARVGLQGEIREWAERERQFKSECARLEQQAQRLTESLSQTQASLAQEAAVRVTAERQAREQAELRRALEQDFAASQRQKENLRAALAAAETTVVELGKNQAALDQELGQARDKVSALSSRVGSLESRLHEEVGQRASREQRATELEQARVTLEQDLAASQRQGESLRGEWTAAQAAVAGLAQKQAVLEGEIREWAEREGRLKSECARLELLGRGLAESLSQTQVLLAQEAAGRKAAEQQAEELAGLRRALEQDLATGRSQKENLGAELMAAQAAVAGLEQKQEALEGKTQEWAERESELKSECARLAQQSQGLTESLNQTQALLAQEAAGRTATEQQAGELSELRRALEQELATSQRQKENLRAELTAAQATVAGLEQKQEALEGWIREWAEREGLLKSECARLEQQGQGLTEMEKRLSEEMGQRENWQRRAAELEQARVALEDEIREGTEREGRLKSECARLERQGQTLTKSLSETQALLAEEADGRTLAKQQAGELVKRLRASEQDLAASERSKENPRANPKADEGSVKLRLPHSRIERRPLNLLQRLGQIARRSMMLSRKPFKFISQRDTGQSRRNQEPEKPNAGVAAAGRPIRASAGIARRRDQTARRAPSRTAERVRRFRAALGGNRRVADSNRGPTGRGKGQRGNRREERK
jgi:PAS domain S-box-containing protein